MKAIGKLINLFCVALLGLLGFSACEGTTEAYGTPTADFLYEGSVTDEDGNPIKGINVILNGSINNKPNEQLIVETNEKGVFGTVEFSTRDTSIDTIDFVDVDGVENGGDFESQTIIPKDNMTITQIKEGDGSWNDGKFVYKADIKLKKK